MTMFPNFPAKARFVVGGLLLGIAALLQSPGPGIRLLPTLLGLLGFSLVGLAAEPPVTVALGGMEWDDLSTLRQIVVLLVCTVFAFVLLGVYLVLDGVFVVGLSAPG